MIWKVFKQCVDYKSQEVILVLNSDWSYLCQRVIIIMKFLSSPNAHCNLSVQPPQATMVELSILNLACMCMSSSGAQGYFFISEKDIFHIFQLFKNFLTPKSENPQCWSSFVKFVCLLILHLEYPTTRCHLKSLWDNTSWVESFLNVFWKKKIFC